MKERIRAYEKEILPRLKKPRANLILKELGQVEFGQFTYPIYNLKTDNQGQKIEVLVSGGVHGDEIAGPYAILKFLDEEIHNYLDDFRFNIYPCVNPSGFEINDWENMDKINLNRHFKDDENVQEIILVKNSIKKGPERYAFTIDLHECDPNYEGEGYTKKDNPTEFWLYEICPEKRLRIGHKIIKALERENIPVSKQKIIHEDKNSKGIIWYPEACGNKIYAPNPTMEGYLAENYTDQAFTTETSMRFSLEERVDVQVKVLKSALKEIKKRESNVFSRILHFWQ